MRASFIVTLLIGLWPNFATAQDALSLVEAQQRAVARAPSLRAASSTAAASNAAVDMLRASYWPRLTGTAQYVYSGPVAEVELPGPPMGEATSFELGQAHTASAGVSLGWRVFDWSRDRQVQAGRRQVEAREAQVVAVELDLERETREVYLRCLYVDRLIEATDASLFAAEQSVKSLTLELEVGLANEVELEAAKARQAELQARRQGLAGDRTVARERLKVLVGAGSASTLSLADRLEVIGQLTAGESSSHPGLDAQEALVAAADAQRRAALKLPFFEVFGSADYRYPQTLVDDSAGPVWSAGARLTWPIWSGGIAKAERRKAEADAAVARANADALNESLDAAATAARAQGEAARQRLTSADAQLAAAKSFLALSKASLDAGTSTALDVLDAEVAVDQARLAKTRAHYELAAALSALWFAQGTRPQEMRP